MYSGELVNNFDPLSVCFSNVSYSVNTKKQGEKQILHSVSGFVQAGSFLAILGPSGAGKSNKINIFS